MNVIFLDFDGVIDTAHFNSNEDVKKRIKLLGEICNELDCKVVISASAKDAINEETMEVTGKWVKFILDCFAEYNIECIGRTPTIPKIINEHTMLSILWKEDEILAFLEKHPEIEHYCVIDDDDLKAMRKQSDLDKVRNHLVTTIYYSEENKEEEGLLEKHKSEIEKILKLDRKIKD